MTKKKETAQEEVGKPDAPETRTTTLAAAVHPSAEGFREKIEPKPIGENVHLYKCACGGVHFRHAGYVELLLPFVEPEGKKVACEGRPVSVCVACKTAFVWISGQAYDVTQQIDLKAWERTEKEAYRATGPGGQC